MLECITPSRANDHPEATGLGTPSPTIPQLTSDQSHHRAPNTADLDLHRLAALTELVSRVSSVASPIEACRTLANALKDACQIERVIVALCPRRFGQCEVTAISGFRQIDSKAEVTILATSAAQECVARGTLGLWPPQDRDNRHALCAHRQLARALDQPALLSVPLADAEGHVRGVCLLAGSQRTVASAELRNFLLAASTPLGSTLGMIQRARGNRFDRLASEIAEFARTHTAKVSIWVALATLCVLLLPIRYHVSCSCELQPVIRRFIAAPFDARLERNHVKPGDVVMAGQLLAQIDARDIQWELASKQAEAQRMAKEMAGHEAAHESGKAEITGLELERLQLVIAQLEEQASSLEIRSPVDGLVLLGDHSKNEGIPLEKGKTLFEIAPLDRMVIELEIPEDDMRFIQPGMHARVRLTAFPLQSFDGVIERVHPRAELKEHDNVFIAEISYENVNDQLRPGMRGSARIATVRRPLAWNWFHKAFVAALTWFGW